MKLLLGKRRTDDRELLEDLAKEASFELMSSGTEEIWHRR
jgi:hypothetical protein